MAYRYPELARFMAGHWATEAVHIVPVFCEGGALMEHWVFNIFYNWPLTIRRRMASLAAKRETLKSRYWHVPFYVAGAAAFLAAADFLYYKHFDVLPGLADTWWLAVIVIFLSSMGITIGCGGAAFSRRIISALVWAILTSPTYMTLSVFWVHGGEYVLREVITAGAWWMFIFAVLAPISVVLTELNLPDPEIKKFSTQ